MPSIFGPVADKYNSSPHLQDRPDFISQMWRLTSERKHQPIDDAASKPPTFHEFEASMIGKVSEATSIEELPGSMVRRLDGHVCMVLMLILHTIYAGVQSVWLHTCIQLCIAQKVPEWLVRNIRPILLEGYINRNGDNNVFQRSQQSAETRGRSPTTCFGYRKQLSPQHAAIAARIVTAIWAVQHKQLWCLDCDEKNAFCNSVRNGHHAVSKDVAFQVEDWVRAICDKMRILLVSPHGLLGPYPMKHGGPQGSSLGVGRYNNVVLVRTDFVHLVLANNLSPETMEKIDPEL